MSSSQAKLEEAIAFHQQGHFAQAKAIYERIVAAEPNRIDALHFLGVISIQTKNYQRAVEVIEKAIAINSHHAGLHSNYGFALQQLNRFEEAIESYDRAIAIKPDMADVYTNRGNALQGLKRWEEAVQNYDCAIKIKPDSADAYNNRGNVLQILKRWEEAVQNYDCAIKLKPNFVSAHSNRGSVLIKLQRWEEAVESFDRAIAIRPNSATIYSKRGIALSALKQWEAVIGNYDRAIAITPDYADAYYNKALASLLTNNFEQGWELYEWRSKLKKVIFHPIKITNVWNGKKMAGSLLVLSEQGLGDEIFYSGMLNDLYGVVDSITVCVDPRLIPLYQRSFEHINFISKKSPVNVHGYDAQIYMGSLGRYFRASEQALRDNVKTPYLNACPEKTRNVRDRLYSNKKLICGLSWVSTSENFGNEKTIRLHDLKSILSLPDIDFVDLQYGDTHEEQAAFYAESGIRLTRIADVDNFQDVDGLASLVDACDIVLTISNTTAHLAGALGKTTIIMLPYADGLLWYWHDGNDKNPWYPTARLVRQHKSGSWESVMDRVKQALQMEASKY